MAIVNIGILAHVDAGKTTLSERILFTAGVIRSLGSVDKGTTQTDTLELERARGITIRSAVVSFQHRQLDINLIDTPGHSDFIAEVERSLHVLDGVVLVISAVEGVQPQTRRLAQAIRAAGLPMLIFVNKIDRLGARGEPLLDEIRSKLNLRTVPLTMPVSLGNHDARIVACDRDRPIWHDTLVDLLAETSEAVIAEYDRTEGAIDLPFLETELRRQVAAGDVVPLCFGSAMTGAGVPELLDGIEDWFPRATENRDLPTTGTIFKIVRRPSGEKIVYARLVSGCLTVRQRVTLRRRNQFGELVEVEERITGIDRFTAGHHSQTNQVNAGEIAGLHGLRAARIGDQIGGDDAQVGEIAPAFPAPKLESVVRPDIPAQITDVRDALEQLAEQDPLMSLRQRNEEGEISVRLYGEVQKEVVGETLLREYGVGVTFGPSQTICIERVAGVGEQFEIIGEGGNPFYGTVGFRVEPAEPDRGICYRRELGSLPLAFYRAIEETVYETLGQGLSGWEVTDCIVTLTHAGFWSPVSTAGDFRKLTPLVLMQALREAGTVVCEPYEALEIEIPEDTFGSVCGALINARATIGDTIAKGTTQYISCQVPTSELRGIEQLLPGLTRGDGGWVSRFAGYIPITGDPPARKRIGPNPLNRAHYLAEVAGVSNR